MNVSGQRSASDIVNEARKAHAMREASAQIGGIKRPAVATANRTRFRVLPITLSLLAVLAFSKGIEVYFGIKSIQSAVASSAPPKEEHGGGEGHGDGEAKEVENPVTEGRGKTTIEEIKKIKKRQSQDQFSAVEVDILQNLKKRREALQAREDKINLKFKVLDVAETRLNKRIDEMRALQRELKVALGRYDEKGDEEIRGLVKIYESMKPSAAAIIFNDLDLPILLSVIDKMSERKVAPVFAAMKPERAKEVTEELAELRKLQRIKSDRAKALANGG
jgi:flagellar motility protein MotE (MotC chaperone)